VPAGNSDGGQWASGGGDNGSQDIGGSSASGNVTPARVLDDITRESDVPIVQFASSNYFRCDGFSSGCQNGGTFGTSGRYNIDGRMLCMDCAIKFFCLQDDTQRERERTLAPFIMK
jgi:hypothetical protein